MQENSNKRVAKNTLFLYFRMILIMLVTLYTSREILSQLGISDYGIYNVVGGVVMMFAFLNSCMVTATQRFLTFELGRSNYVRLKQVFSASLNIHIAIALVIALFAETLGLWFLNYKMVIPPDRLIAANWVYQFAILTFCTDILQAPYNASIIAHEKMSIYAYISILEAFLKLGIVYLLAIVKTDKLIVYGILVFIVQFIIRSIYQVYCRKKYEECKFHIFWDKSLYKEMATFAGWNMFGSVAWIMRDQGLNIVLNLFFGPIVNAARGIAMQVSSAVMNFTTNFQMALNPQITKDYAMGEIEDMEKLVYRGIKFSFILLFFISFPLILNVNYVLQLWLKDVPEYAESFVILITIDSIVSVFFGYPLISSLSATGKVRNYQVVVSCILLMIIPVAYLVLSLGGAPSSVFYITIIFSFISGLTRFLFCRIQIGFSLKKFTKEVVLPAMGILVMSLPIPLLFKYNVHFQSPLLTFLCLCSISVMVVGCFSWIIGLRRNEKYMILNIVKKKLKR